MCLERVYASSKKTQTARITANDKVAEQLKEIRQNKSWRCGSSQEHLNLWAGVLQQDGVGQVVGFRSATSDMMSGGKREAVTSCQTLQQSTCLTVQQTLAGLLSFLPPVAVVVTSLLCSLAGRGGGTLTCRGELEVNAAM